MKISIVIPVYNEAEHLGACLEAIAAQTVQPFEVIVVDNNSTDETAAVARRYSFVRLLHEPRQGVVHARDCGFDAAKGEIIGRLDADSIVPADWVVTVGHFFETTDVAAISGAPHYYDFMFPRIADGIDHFMRARLARKLGDNNFLYGANMALRRSAWRQVRPLLCAQKAMHEDFDLAIHLQELGFTVAYEAHLVTSVSSRRIDTSFRSYARYTLVSPHTYARHKLKSRRHMYPVVLVCWLCYLPGHLLYRGFNTETGTFSLQKLLAANTTSPRIDPTTNVV